MNIICDTSFLLILVAKPIKRINIIENFYGKINFIVPDLVIRELESLVIKSNIKKSNNAKIALKISENWTKAKIPEKNLVDESIINYASLKKLPVATMDKELTKKLIMNQVIVLTLRKNKLIILNRRETNRQT